MDLKLCLVSLLLAAAGAAPLNKTSYPTGIKRRSTMHAFVATSSSGSQEFKSDFAVPSLGDLHSKYDLKGSNASACEVLIQVAASSVNPSDIHPTIAIYPSVLGSDVAGVVTSVGEGCTRLKVGDRVWGDIGANTHTTTDKKTKELGAYAEYAVALESQLAIVPPTWTLTEAGAMPKVALTSYKALVWYAGALSDPLWKKKPTVLVLGGSGGTGSVALQLAKTFSKGGATIVTTTAAANGPYCRSLGATRIIDYKTTDWWNDDVVADNTVDIIYDCVGQEGTGDRAMAKLRSGGYYVTITGALATHTKPGVKQAMFINSDTNLDSAALLDDLSALGAKGELGMPHIDGIFRLQDVKAAFTVSAGHGVVGKLSISVSNSTGLQ